MIAWLLRRLRLVRQPVRLLLRCEHCTRRHVDFGTWAKRPHRRHRCVHCGGEWQPAHCYTVGVDRL